MKTRAWFLAILCLILLAGSAFPPAAAAQTRTLFVKASGSGGLCTQAAPCTLATALGQAQDGDTVYLAGGTYYGTGDAVATVSNSIVLSGGWDGAASGTVIVDPVFHRTTLDGQWQRRGIHIPYGDPIISNLVITQGQAADGGGVYIQDGRPLLTACVIHNNRATQSGAGIAIFGGDAVINGNLITNNITEGTGGGVYVIGQTTALLERNRFTGNEAYTGAVLETYRAAAVSFLLNEATGNRGHSALNFQGSGSESAMLIGNLIAGNQVDGTAVLLSAYIATLVHNTIARNGAMYGVGVAGGSKADLINNIVADCEMGVSVAEGSFLTGSHNLFWHNYADPTPGDQPVFGDPCFLSPSSKNYRLGPGSAAIDAGIAAGVITDLDYNVRPLGAGYDIGAYETLAIFGTYVPRMLKP